MPKNEDMPDALDDADPEELRGGAARTLAGDGVRVLPGGTADAGNGKDFLTVDERARSQKT